MAVEYQIYLRLKEGQRTDVVEENRYIGGTYVTMQPITTLEAAREAYFKANSNLVATHDVVAYEPYRAFVEAAQLSGQWGSGLLFYRNRAKWLMKKSDVNSHPVKLLAHIDDAYYIEGDPHGMTLLMTEVEAMRYATIVFPLESAEKKLERIKTARVYTME